MMRAVRSALHALVLLLFAASALAQQAPLVCDVDVDADIDRNDIALISAARNQLASGPTDPRDPDRDGRITVNDARICTLRCTMAQCAIPPVNRAPVANAGADQTAFIGNTVTVNGSASTDADGDPLSYLWTLISAPTGSLATLADPTSVMPSFVADVAGQYRVTLVVNDGRLASTADEVRVTIVPANTQPVANAGPDQAAVTGVPVTLDGSGSSDVDGDALQFSWALTGPAGSTAALLDSQSVRPSFTPDVAGLYSAALTVSDGRGGSATDSVDVTTALANRAPIANAGADQSVAVGDTVLLDGSGSLDADSDPLTYQWTFLSRPTGSTATLLAATTAAPSFLADRAGNYVVQLIVRDGALNSAPDTVLISTINTPPLANAGPDQEVTEGDTVQLDSSGSSDADGDALSYLWSFTSVPAGSSAGISDPFFPAPTFVADLDGLYVVQLIVNDGALDSAPNTMTVTANARQNQPSLSLSLQSPLVGVGRTVNGAVTLGDPAPAGGVSVALSSSSAATATVAPSVLFIPEGATQAPFTVQGIAAGTATISAAATGFPAATIDIGVTSNLISIGAIPTVAPGQTLAFPVSLSSPATGNVTITFASNDPSIATVTPSVVIPNGLQVPSANPAITGVGIGTTQITATASGFAPDTRPVTVTLTLSFSPTSFTLVENTTQNITLNLSAPAPAGGLTFNLATANTGVATVPALVAVPAGQLSAPVAVTAVTPGSTTLTATATGITPATASITVNNAPPINIGNFTVGRNLQEGVNGGALGAAAPPVTGVSLTITSAEPSRLLLSTSATTVGTASIALSVAGNGTAIPQFFLHALDSSGTVQFTTSAPGYATDTSTVTLTPSGFIISSPSLINTSTFAANTNVQITSARLAPGTLAWQTSQSLRPGVSATVNVSSSDPVVGAIVGSPAAFASGQGAVNLAFDPVSQGTTTLEVAAAAGFDTPSNSRQITATVTAPTISGFTGNSARVGEDMQKAVNVSLSVAPPSPVDVTVTIASGAIARVSDNGAVLGGTTVVIPNVANTTIRTLFLQGLLQGTTQVTISAPGYATNTQTITVDPSGFIIDTPSAISTTTFAANSSVRISASRLQPGTLAWQESEAVRAGLTVPVSLANSNAAVGSLTPNPLSFGPNVSVINTAFDPANEGSTVLAVTPPGGFETPSNFRQITATVTAPAISGFTGNSARVGEDMQEAVNVSLGVAPPSPVDVTVTIVSGAIARVSDNSAVLGGTTVVIPNVANTTVRTLFLQGLLQGTTQVTVSAPGYATNTQTIMVDPSGFIVDSPSAINTTTFTANSTMRITAARLLPGTLAWQENEAVRAGLTVPVSLTSSNATVGSITPNTLSFGPNVSAIATEFDPLTNGSTVVAVTPPAGFDAPSNFRQITATVTAPAINGFTGNSARVGEDLQEAVNVSLSVAPPSPVDITITLTSGAIARLSDNGTVLGVTTVVIPNVANTSTRTVFLQGMLQGTTQVTLSAPGYATNTQTVTVDPSGFIINSPGAINTTAGAANSNVQITPARLLPGTFQWQENETVRAGLSVQVPVTSSNSAAGVITVSPLTFGANVVSVTTQFDPVAAGTTTVTVGTPAGFDAPNNFRQVPVTVNP